MQSGLRKTDDDVRAQLAARIAAIEDHQPSLDGGEEESKRVSVGISEIDHALDPENGAGIEFAALHEIRSATTLSFAAAAGFALALGNHMERWRMCQSARLDNGCEHRQESALRPIFWVADKYCQSEAGEFYGPGLYPMGVEPSRLIRISPRDFDEAVWAAGEIASTAKIAFGLLEVRENPRQLDLATTRRLKLRCRKFQTPFFILRQAGTQEASAAATRWLVEPALSQAKQHKNFVGMAAWKIKLEKCSGGKTGNWILEWNHHEQSFGITKSQAKKSTKKLLAALSGNSPTAIGNGPHLAQTAGAGVAAKSKRQA